jgi:MFS superfamily sulfate permease-like transporter
MHKPTSGFKGFLANLPNDFKAGFVVSLVALPISIALALASGAPAIAGIISAAIGGVVVAHLGGSYVTITGPGNGLAVITLMAITTLGKGDMVAGYYMALAAIVCSGILMLLLGMVRLGVLADLFPTSAVKGMLAAIGIIILAKQSHVMIGTLDPEGSAPIPLLLEFFKSMESLLWANFGHKKSAAVGLGSLLILVLFSRVRAPWFHVIPAPLWVVVFSVSIQWFGTRYTGSSFFPTEFLVNIPADWMSSWQLPNFQGMNESSFWTAVFSLTFIASIESLLSIKGMDRLDPYKRRSNVNRDLRALGIATIISGILGGLNVVTVIARSSVNVSNGARTRSSNFFQGVLILVFVVFFRDLLTQIPLPALAAILVFTGYKLLNPAQFRNIAEVGLEQLFLFFITLIATLIYGLIVGILIGMVATILVQAFITGAGGDILRYFRWPNTLLYEEEDNKYILNVNYFANFLNYPRLKSKLDNVPNNATLIADFSNTKFVDHTVMEHLSTYVELFEQKGGTLEIVGLEAFVPTSMHPMGVQSRGNRQKARLNEARNSWLMGGQQEAPRLSAKQEKLSAYGILNAMDYLPWPDAQWDAKLQAFQYFTYRRIDLITNVLRDEAAGIVAMEVSTHSGEFIVKDSQQMACVVIEPNAGNLPEFILDRERIFERLAQYAGIRDVQVGHEKFDQRFKLRGPKPEAIQKFFTQECIEFLLDHPSFHMESNGHSLLIFHKERVASVSEFKLMVSFAREWSQRMNVQAAVLQE